MTKRKVLLVGWDAADWKVINPLMDKGEMPHLSSLIDRGVMGNLMTLQPVLSPMLWNSIATGKRADQHGIHGFTVVDKDSGQTRPFGTMDREVKGVWNILNQEGLTPHVVNWFCGHPAEPLRGSDTTELITRQVMQIADPTTRPELPPDSVYPEDLREVISSLRVWPQDIDSETIQLFVPKFREVDQDKDKRLEMIAKQLASCFTTHAVTTWLMENREWDFIGSYFGEIDHFGHGFMKYHPPRRPHIAEQDFDLYHDVVNSAYRLHDLLLGRYLQLADEDTTILVCSDHGFHADHHRPKSIPRTPTGPAEEHRLVGMMAMAGPGIKKDELVHGATLLDIAPTLLALYGLPIGADMEGRVLVEAFENPPDLKTIPSWEDVPGEDGMVDRNTKLSEEESAKLIQQFVELGYIDAPEGNQERDNAVTTAENQWNLARVLLSKGDFTKALPLLEEAYHLFPLRFDIGLRLAECLCTLGLAEEGREVANNLAAAYPNRPWAWMVQGLAELNLHNREEALDLFKKVEEVDPALSGLHLQLGRSYLGMHKPLEAQKAFTKGLEGDPDNILLLQGLANCAYTLKDYDTAVNYSLDALGLEFALPRCHLILGQSLIRLEQISEAVQALETCIHYAPNWPAPLQMLRMLYRHQEQPEKLPDIKQKLVKIRRVREENKERLEAIRRDLSTRKRARELERLQEGDDLTADVLTESERPKPEIRRPSKAGQHTPGSSGKEFMIVSGLPRSGTSLMMQMLRAGGLPPMTDQQRAADEDNPEGYFEWEAVKKLGSQPHLIERAEGKATKVISMLLGKLPPIHRYKVIFMDRPVAEVSRSQSLMIEHRRGEEPKRNQKAMEESLIKHREKVLKLLEALPHIELLTLSYPELVASPETFIDDIQDFVGRDLLPDAGNMVTAVRPDLYRNSGGKE